MSDGGSGNPAAMVGVGNASRRRGGWSRGRVRRLGIGRGWISGHGGLRVDFDGNLYVLDSQEEGAGWDANYIPESETQEADIIGPYVADSEDVRVLDDGFFVPETQDSDGVAGLVGKEAVDVGLDDGEDGVADIGVEDNTVGVEEMTSCVGVKDRDAAMVDLHEGIDMCSSVVVEALVHLDASFKFSGYPVFFLVLLLHFISFNTASNMFA